MVNNIFISLLDLTKLGVTRHRGIGTFFVITNSLKMVSQGIVTYEHSLLLPIHWKFHISFLWLYYYNSLTVMGFSYNKYQKQNWAVSPCRTPFTMTNFLAPLYDSISSQLVFSYLSSIHLTETLTCLLHSPIHIYKMISQCALEHFFPFNLSDLK